MNPKMTIFIPIAMLAIAPLMAGCEASASRDQGPPPVQSPMGYVPPTAPDVPTNVNTLQPPIAVEPVPAPEITIDVDAPAVRVIAEDGAFSPARITARPGQPVEVLLINRDNAARSLRLTGTGGEVLMQEQIAAGQSRTLRFRAPERPGTYSFSTSAFGTAPGPATGTLVVLGSP